jgi:hypothetical protein
MSDTLDEDVAYLRGRIHPDVFRKLAARLRECEGTKRSGKVTLVVNVPAGGGLPAVVPDWGEVYTVEKKGA